MRFAIYFAPDPAHPLHEAGSRWLGRDAVTGAALPQTEVDGIAAPRLSELTADARRYGFHATLKAPFALAPDASDAGLRAALEGFAARQAAFELPLAVSRIGSFLALTPEGRPARLHDLADRVVETFEPFRAALTAADIARRRPERLTPRQRELLEGYGYPYVFDEFRFHMTLSDRVERGEAEAVAAAAERHFASLIDRPVRIDRLALFVEPAPGAPFRPVAYAPMAG